MKLFTRFPKSGGVLLSAALLASFILIFAGSVHSYERKLTLSFTKEIFYTLASDNLGEKNAEMIQRIIGLSPAIKRASIRREGDLFILSLVTEAEEAGSVIFNLYFDKMDIYKMAMARTDVAGIKSIMDKLGAREKYIKKIDYRINDLYSMIDIVLDIDKYLEDIRAEEAKKAPPPAKKEPKKEVVKKPSPPAKKVEKKPAKPPEPKVVEKKTVTKPPAKVAKKPTPPPPPKEPPKPPPPPEPESVVVKKVKKAPVVDGSLNEAVWSDLQAFKAEAKGPSGNATVLVKAVHDGENIYMSFSWPDSGINDKHKPWIWNKAKGDYESSSSVEDGIAVQFSDKNIPECMTAGKEFQADIWHWKAGRTNPSGFAEDGWLVVSGRKLPQANSYKSSQGQSVWIKIYRDAGKPPYRSEIIVIKREEEEPRYLSQAPSGSMADVKAKGLWVKGRWNVEMTRKLTTGNTDDITFSRGNKKYYLSMSIFNAAEGKNHITTPVIVMNVE